MNEVHFLSNTDEWEPLRICSIYSINISFLNLMFAQQKKTQSVIDFTRKRMMVCLNPG